ncbi:tyrosine-type recombinase/integrase [Pseudoxanthobacter sp. M-2]|uniref:tyrosine-type recombinase/integrase n=1 Tax=Pseudoxanthobacter sp. M-2 TaxID=3078754 RepID=UPI0038FC4F78
MPVATLTDRFVSTAKPAAGKRQTEFFDGLVRGLAFLVSSGGARSWFLIFTRPADGKRARIKLGTYPEMSLAEARRAARETRARIGEGVDPVAAKAAEAAAMRVRDLVESYLARHVVAKRSAAEIGRRLRKNVVEAIGDVKLSALHRRDVTRAIDAVADRGAVIEANRVAQDLRAMLRWAAGRGDVDPSIALAIRLPTPATPRERVLSAGELRTVWAALPAAGMTEGMRRILRLCLITGQRVGEVAGMTRDEIDLDAAVWTIPGRRAKNGRDHVVPLSPMALATIRRQLADVDAADERRERREGRGRGATPFVFPAPGGRAPITVQAVSKAVKREESPTAGAKVPTAPGVAPWTPHDLRRTAATHMEELGVSPFVVGHVLNHVSVTRASITSRVYARYDYAREKREALELWANRLAAIVSAPDVEPHVHPAAAQ